MLSQFQIHLQNNFAFLHGKRLLLAVSGGLDSIVMTDLFLKSGYQIAIAHCNFNLRGDESDQDEAFIREFAVNKNILAFVTKFDTQKFATDFGLSIQVAARELRYKYFYELIESEQYDYALTAHHADDNFETFLINLSRGTGIDGLTGIPEQNEKVVRPLLPFSREAIHEYAKSNNLQWREDSSNASDRYLRNKIRQQIVPVLKEIRPDLLDNFSKTQEFLRQTQTLAEDASVLVYQKVAKTFGEEIRIDLSELLKLPNFRSYLYQWLNGFGFTAWTDIYALTEAQSGKQVFSQTHVLLKDRQSLILSPLSDPSESREYLIYKGMEHLDFPLNIDLKYVKNAGENSNTSIFVDAEKLSFPLALRKWKDGDVIHPSGMNGNSKKVSKFFKDEKFSLREKENAWLLCSADAVVWIVGHRQDERFSIQTTTTNILHIEINP